jgi:hypothetical protein
VCTNAPLVPVTVSVDVPTGVDVEVVTVSVDEPGTTTGLGLKTAVAPAGVPANVRVTLPVNPFIAVVETV